MVTPFFPFTPLQVRTIVPTYRPGVYLLAKCEGTKLVSGYVGRSDKCLRHRLVYHNLLGHFDYFTFKITVNAEQAFLEEAGWWHFLKDEGFIVNDLHPASPRKRELTCPFCGIPKHFREFLYQRRMR